MHKPDQHEGLNRRRHGSVDLRVDMFPSSVRTAKGSDAAEIFRVANSAYEMEVDERGARHTRCWYAAEEMQIRKQEAEQKRAPELLNDPRQFRAFGAPRFLSIREVSDMISTTTQGPWKVEPVRLIILMLLCFC